MIGTLPGFREYQLARGNSGPTDATDANATAALVRASDHMEAEYIPRLLPEYSETTEKVIEATYILSAFELTSPGTFSKIYTPDQAKVLTAVDGIKWTPVGDGKSDAQNSVPVSTAVDRIMRTMIAFTDGARLV